MRYSNKNWIFFKKSSLIFQNDFDLKTNTWLFFKKALELQNRWLKNWIPQKDISIIGYSKTDSVPKIAPKKKDLQKMDRSKMDLKQLNLPER